MGGVGASDRVEQTMTMRVMLHGARGRMGMRVKAACAEHPQLARVTCQADADDETQVFVTAGAADIDVLIDFSTDEGARRACELALHLRRPLLIGTTGLSDGTLESAQESSQTVAVLIAPNTSLGVAVLTRLCGDAAAMLGPGYTIDVTDEHHAAKRDAPSGTARHLGAELERRGGRVLASERFHCIRAGSIVGEHEVQFSGQNEVLRLSHSAGSRDLFAHGALEIAEWLRHQGPGLHTIDQWLDQRIGARPR